MQSVYSRQIDFVGFTLVRAERIQERKRVALFLRKIILFANVDRLENLRTESHEKSFENKLFSAIITCSLVHHMKEASRYYPNSGSLLDSMLIHYEDGVTKLHYMSPCVRVIMRFLSLISM